ncbi:MAG: chemotaxis protein CheW [Pseudomonadota bacterium]
MSKDGEARHNFGELEQMFVEEAREHVSRIEPDLLSLEDDLENPDPEKINCIFRELHSIKGSASFFGLEKISKLSHVMENLLSLIRDGKLLPNRDLLDALLAGVDRLQLMINDVDNSQSVDISRELGALEEILGNQENHAPESGKSNAKTEKKAKGKRKKDTCLAPPPLEAYRITKDNIEESISNGRFLYSVRVNTYGDIRDKGKTLHDYLKSVESLGIILDGYLDLSEIEGLDDCLEKEISLVFVFSTVLEPGMAPLAVEVPEEQIRKLEIKECKEDTGEESPGAGSKEDKAQESKPQTEAEGPEEQEGPKPSGTADRNSGQSPQPKQSSGLKSEETLRVHVSLLDDLMNMAGELVLGRNQLLRMTSGMAKSIPGLPALLQHINLITSDLQEKIMHTRMQPVGVVLNKFPRIIRDLARRVDKEIQLELSGNDVELDKSIIENLSDPLTHLIRNAADHGIEMPEERKQKGKPASGKVEILAYHEGGQVNIDIIDDGRGIDVGKIKAKALARGMATKSDLDRTSDREVLKLIFAPGFSLAEKISDISGRGVGMDVVRTNIEKLGGTVSIDSRINEGTRISLKLPLTLAIIPSLIISVNGQKFALPQMGLVELVRLKKHDLAKKIEMVHNARVLRLRDKLLPLVHLSDVLRMEGEENQEEGAGDKDAIRVLVLKLNEHRFGLIVDEIHDTEEIVVKSVPRFFKSCPCYAGTTIMGDGRVALILDVAGIAAKAELRFISTEEEKRIRAEVDNRAHNLREKQKILLFENAPGEYFGVNLDLIMRVEKIPSGDLEEFGDKEFIKHEGGMLRLIRLENFLPVKRPESGEKVCVIVPKNLDRPVGIVAQRIVDSLETEINLDQKSISAKGLIGSAIIRDKIVGLIDIYGLKELADPGDEVVGGAGNHGNGRSRLLLVEDTPFFREVGKKYLNDAGYEVTTAGDGMEALDLLEKEEFDLVITDICMPRLDGFGLLKAIKENKKLERLPVLALTSLGSDEDRERGLRAGFDDYETKLNSRQLIKKAEKLLAMAE